MDTSISDSLISKNIKKKPKRKSPLSDTYKKFLKKEDISLSPTKKTKPTKIEDIKINVIKSPEIHKENNEKPCKRKRVRIKKSGKINKDNLKHNKEKQQKKQQKKEQLKLEKQKKIEKPKKKSSKKKKSSRKKKSKKLKKKSFKKEVKKTKSLTDDSMKNELLKDGIEIKGNNKKLLRDIYAFSKLGGIKVHKE